MEHRWGERVALHQTVELSWSASPPVAGSLENVSSSGAFVRTAGHRPPRGPVDVTFYAQAARLEAYVVRQTDIGVGIEWCEFAPSPVCELISRGKRRLAARARAPASTRHAPRDSGATTDSAASAPADAKMIGANGSSLQVRHTR